MIDIEIGLRILVILTGAWTIVMLALCLPSWRAQSNFSQVIGVLLVCHIVGITFSMIEQIRIHLPVGSRTIMFIIIGLVSAVLSTKVYVEQIELRTVYRFIHRETEKQRRDIAMAYRAERDADDAGNASTETPLTAGSTPDVVLSNEPTQAANKGQTVKRTTVQSVIGNIIGFLVIAPIIMGGVQTYLGDYIPVTIMGYLATASAVAVAVSALLSWLMAQPKINAWLTSIGLGARTKELQSTVENVSNAGEPIKKV